MREIELSLGIRMLVIPIISHSFVLDLMICFGVTLPFTKMERENQGSFADVQRRRAVGPRICCVFFSRKVIKQSNGKTSIIIQINCFIF